MLSVHLGCGQITWPVEASEDEVLEDIRKAEYEGAPWGFDLGRGRGDSSRPAKEIEAVLSRHELRPAPGFLWGDFWESERRPEFVSLAHRYAEVSAALGLRELYVAAGGFDRVMPSGRTRRQAAGHATTGDSLPDAEFHELVEGLHAVAAATMEHGVRSCYHNHVGTVVETEQEIEAMLAISDPDLVWLGPDTGHLAWAGVDVVPFCERHAERIKTMHIKDVNADVRDRGSAAGWDYATFSDSGVWTEIATGCVDFAKMFAVLSSHDFSGWLVVETDVTQLSSPLESATVSRRNLRRFAL
jgi:inosose dehydratase